MLRTAVKQKGHGLDKVMGTYVVGAAEDYQQESHMYFFCYVSDDWSECAGRFYAVSRLL